MASAPTLEVQSLMNESPMNSRRWGVVALCFTIALLDGFDTQSIAFIGPAIAEEFGMQTADMTWVITASTVGMAIGAMSLGSLGDKIGRKKAVMLALAFFGVFSLIAGQPSASGRYISLTGSLGSFYCSGCPPL
jgi:AAHS family 4-hydroxybenzoate transporter-like MFS transporter